MLKRILHLLIGAFVIAQVFRPDLSSPPADPNDDMLAVLHAPDDIKGLVIGACYDCHSHHTVLPWYVHVTPVNYWMKDHIEEGREHLNFSVWSKYAGSHDAGEAAEEVEEGEMPPGYYSFMHGAADLSDADREKLVNWFRTNLPERPRKKGRSGRTEH